VKEREIVNRSKLRLSLLIASLILLSTTLGVAPVKASPSSNSINPQSETGTWELVYYEDLGWKDTIVGYIYSAQHLRVTFRLRFSSKIEWKYSIDGGILHVGGTKSFGYSVEDEWTLENGATATIYYRYFYRYYYYEWTGTPPPECKEEWIPIDFNELYGYIDPPAKEIVGSYYKDMTINPGAIKRVYFNEIGGSWLSIGTAIKLTGTWERFKGEVPLGGSFYMYFEESTKIVYEYRNLDSVRHVWEMYKDAWIFRPVLKS